MLVTVCKMILMIKRRINLCRARSAHVWRAVHPYNCHMRSSQCIVSLQMWSRLEPSYPDVHVQTVCPHSRGQIDDLAPLKLNGVRVLFPVSPPKASALKLIPTDRTPEALVLVECSVLRCKLQFSSPQTGLSCLAVATDVSL